VTKLLAGCQAERGDQFPGVGVGIEVAKATVCGAIESTAGGNTRAMARAERAHLGLEAWPQRDTVGFFTLTKLPRRRMFLRRSRDFAAGGARWLVRA
jgi:hypothetical protein